MFRTSKKIEQLEKKIAMLEGALRGFIVSEVNSQLQHHMWIIEKKRSLYDFENKNK